MSSGIRINYFAKKGMKELAQGLNDKYAQLSRSTIDKLSTSKFAKDADVISAVDTIANTENDTKTKAASLEHWVKAGDGNT